jgi:hypothetical protein
MEQLLTLLLAYLETIPVVREARVFNNQLKHLPDQEQLLWPAVLVEPFNIVYTTLSGPYQTVNCSIRFHIVNESPLQGDEMTIYQLKDQVHQYLFGFTGGGLLEPLQRDRENLDYSHDNLYDYQVEYSTRFTDMVEPLDEVTVQLAQIDLDYDLDVDNPVIRTGDSQGYDFIQGRHDQLRGSVV